MIQMIYDYNIEYTTKFLAFYDVDINNTDKTCLSFNIVYQFSWPNGYSDGSNIQGS